MVEAGELFAVTGLPLTAIGDGVGFIPEKNSFEMVPTLKSKVNFEPLVSIREALQYFKQLDSEDPSLNVTWEECLQEIQIHVMGKIQLEVLEQVVWDRFQLRVTFTEPEILYKETIASEVIGYGHFEPLGHYAEVHLKIEPGLRNSGIAFENKCHADDLTVGNQNLVRHHLFEKGHHGILSGSPITDVKVTLLTGRAHNKHTSGRDLSFDSPITDGNKAILTGIVPVATFMNYSSQLASFTQGKGYIQLVFAGYNRCHNEKEVIDKISYNKNADPEYSSSSIFCSKGQGYSVVWNEVEGKMHCL